MVTVEVVLLYSNQAGGRAISARPPLNGGKNATKFPTSWHSTILIDRFVRDQVTWLTNAHIRLATHFAVERQAATPVAYTVERPVNQRDIERRSATMSACGDAVDR